MFEGSKCVLVETDEISATQLFCIDLDKLALEVGLFSEKIAPVVKYDIVHSVIKREQTVMKRGCV